MDSLELLHRAIHDRDKLRKPDRKQQQKKTSNWKIPCTGFWMDAFFGISESPSESAGSLCSKCSISQLNVSYFSHECACELVCVCAAHRRHCLFCTSMAFFCCRIRYAERILLSRSMSFAYFRLIYYSISEVPRECVFCVRCACARPDFKPYQHVVSTKKSINLNMHALCCLYNSHSWGEMLFIWCFSCRE